MMEICLKVTSGFAAIVCIYATYKNLGLGDYDKAIIFFSLSVFWGNEVFK